MPKQKKYNIILADPPWDTGYVVGGEFAGTVKGGKELPYPTMTDDEIMALPVMGIAAPDAMLFMWFIDSRLPKCVEIMAAWGFNYKGIAFVWNKTTKNGNGKVRTTLTPYTRRSCELVLLGTKGKVRDMVANHYVLQYIGMPSITRLHSAKPPIVREKIVQLMGDLPRIELFARRPEPTLFGDTMAGWDVWGNEMSSDIELSDK